MITLILYSRSGCHLCEELAAQVDDLLQGVRLHHVDVSTDPELERRYGLRIPVLAAGDVELSSYPLDRERVRHYLETARASA